MRRSQQALSVPSKQTQSSNAKDELSSTASINASSTTLIPSSELLASKPRDSTLKREQNSCYEHDNGLRYDPINLLLRQEKCRPCYKRSFEHLIGAGEQGRRDFEAQCPGGLEIDQKLDVGRKFHRQVAPVGALLDFVD